MINPFYQDDQTTIYHGDCSSVMATMPDNSIDTILTDPPYGLEFMGKDWDHGVPGIVYWQEALRVAKPGAMLIAFGGTRTYHRLACAIEDAGWIIRDCIMWVYGSGFPKSSDIGKAIDKKNGAEREVVGPGQWHSPGRTKAWGDGVKYGKQNSGDGDGKTITIPASPEAQLWDGWGTGLKPAYEPILLAMKPLDGTFVENALKWGVAGLWIDGGRIGVENMVNQAGQLGSNGIYGKMERNDSKTVAKGRWPANLIHDGSDEVLREFPVTSKSSGGQSGVKKSGMTYSAHSNEQNNIKGCGFGDTGTAARFFYCAKASRKERGEGNNHPTVKPQALLKYLATLTRTPTNGIVLDPFGGSCSTALACRAIGRPSIMIDKDLVSCQIGQKRIENIEQLPVKTNPNGTQPAYTQGTLGE